MTHERKKYCEINIFLSPNSSLSPSCFLIIIIALASAYILLYKIAGTPNILFDFRRHIVQTRFTISPRSTTFHCSRLLISSCPFCDLKLQGAVKSHDSIHHSLPSVSSVAIPRQIINFANP